MSKSNPIIGITSYGRNDDHRFTLPAEYVDSVRRAGGIPVMLPPGEPHIESLLETLDGVIIAGGGDIDPKHYAGKRHATNYMMDDERDTSEITMTKHLLDTEIPIFGICRGTQILNVALGGTLIEHLPDEVGEDVNHRVEPRNPTLHTVHAESGSLLAKTIGQVEFDSLSWHHQAIRQVAAPLHVVATAPDGTIEAVEMSSYPWLVAVQWHPELTAKDDPLQQKLFDALVEAASLRKGQ